MVDSSACHEKSWEALADEEKLPLPPDHFKKGFGMKNEWIIPKMLKWAQDPSEVHRLSRRKEALYREITAKAGIELLPGVKALLENLKNNGVRTAVGSSTQRENIDLIISLTGIGDFFSAFVTAEDVHLGKPHPEVFLKAAEKLSLPTHRAVVIEDAHVGIEAARAGGIKVLAVATTHPRSTLLDADKVVASLTEVSVGLLGSMITH